MDRIVTFLLLLVSAVLLAPGCIADEQAVSEVTEIVPEVTVTEEVTETVTEEVTAEVPAFDVTADMNTTALNMTQNQIVLVTLPETSGYEWNTTVSEGLTLLNETHVDAAEGDESATALHQMFVQAVAAGEQTIKSVEQKADSEETGSEYTLTILVE
ncbi:protease inhibitor I42 family protein [Methanospirillum stamsii]|uniref:Proteinase inhibitor I42 chagasin domain-containing protein n=1 Tax=Methanospirillum stamsii TaxID=1277351 RepID=A0A2V2N4X7_9EURY|nr:protease inhibitor I42 family protein [Methanospirillum stamsii]PWR70313.1 hypothetical protein DLD82_16035 [Methanospirillum stamsii]